MEIDKKGDTTWVKRAEKHFNNISEINNLYKADPGVNSVTSRHAFFEKKSGWFNTTLRFSEIIDTQLPGGYPISDFLNPEELRYTYATHFQTDLLKDSQDSLKYRNLEDSTNKKEWHWFLKVYVSEFIKEFIILTEKQAQEDPINNMKKKEDELVKFLTIRYMDSDDIWDGGILSRQLLGDEYASKFKIQADSAFKITNQKMLIDFAGYTVTTVMPGRITGTNGYIDNKKTINWSVNSGHFLTQTYDMWVESKVVNIWAWIVTIIIMIFVITGIINKPFRQKLKRFHWLLSAIDISN